MAISRRESRNGIFFYSFLLILLAFFFSVPNASAQEKFPSKPVKMVITHGAGGSVDIPSRGIAQFMPKYLGAPVVCENMEGAGGRRAMEYVFNQAKPDGYTFVASAFPSRLLGQLLYDSKYSMKDYVHLASWVGGDPRVIFVAKDSPFKSFKDIAQEAKKRKVTVATGGGLGSSSHLHVVFLKEIVKLNLELIPFESAAEATAATLGKHVDFGVGQLSGSLRTLKTGETRIIVVHAVKRHKDAPDIPTMLELGYEGVDILEGVGGWAPPKTPKEIVSVLSQAILKSANDPEFRKWGEKNSLMIDPLGPEEFYKVTLADYAKISKVLPILKQSK